MRSWRSRRPGLVSGDEAQPTRVDEVGVLALRAAGETWIPSNGMAGSDLRRAMGSIRPSRSKLELALCESDRTTLVVLAPRSGGTLIRVGVT